MRQDYDEQGNVLLLCSSCGQLLGRIVAARVHVHVADGPEEEHTAAWVEDQTIQIGGRVLLEPEFVNAKTRFDLADGRSVPWYVPGRMTRHRGNRQIRLSAAVTCPCGATSFWPRQWVADDEAHAFANRPRKLHPDQLRELLTEQAADIYLTNDDEGD